MAGSGAKVVIVGDAGVGKTSLLSHFLTGRAAEPYPTIGADATPKAVMVDGKEVRLSLWDTAGQETFKSIVPMFARGAQVGIVVFDLASPASFAGVPEWLAIFAQDQNPCPVILVGNKSDLKGSIKPSDVVSFTKSHKLRYFEASARSGAGVGAIFEAAAEIVAHPPAEPIRAELPPENRPCELEVAHKTGGCCG
jgi:small GTP-binding protein